MNASQGDNIVLGDNGRIVAATEDAPRFGTQAITLGRIETTAPEVGGDDVILAGIGYDIVLGGLAATRST